MKIVGDSYFREMMKAFSNSKKYRIRLIYPFFIFLFFYLQLIKYKRIYLMDKSVVKALLNTIDSMDATKFAEFITENGKFTFGNNPTAEGRKNIASGVDAFFSSIKGLKHTLLGHWEQDDTVILELGVIYTRHDGKEVSLKAVDVFTMEGNLISDYKIYMDITPVYA